MKFLVILALFMVNATLCCAQQAVVSSDRMNILYAGVENRSFFQMAREEKSFRCFLQLRNRHELLFDQAA